MHKNFSDFHTSHCGNLIKLVSTFLSLGYNWTKIMNTLVHILACVFSIPHQIFITAINALNKICKRERKNTFYDQCTFTTTLTVSGVLLHQNCYTTRKFHNLSSGVLPHIIRWPNFKWRYYHPHPTSASTNYHPTTQYTESCMIRKMAVEWAPCSII